MLVSMLVLVLNLLCSFISGHRGAPQEQVASAISLGFNLLFRA
jgi:hypothetical protein